MLYIEKKDLKIVCVCVCLRTPISFGPTRTATQRFSDCNHFSNTHTHTTTTKKSTTKILPTLNHNNSIARRKVVVIERMIYYFRLMGNNRKIWSHFRNWEAFCSLLLLKFATLIWHHTMQQMGQYKRHIKTRLK